jgi:hypothetical protein
VGAKNVALKEGIGDRGEVFSDIPLSPIDFLRDNSYPDTLPLRMAPSGVSVIYTVLIRNCSLRVPVPLAPFILVWILGVW